MNSSLRNSVTFSRHAKIIWKPNLHLNDGTADIDANTFEQLKYGNTSFEKIEFEHYALPTLVLVVGILGLLFLYVCFWKWVAKVIIRCSPMKLHCILIISRETLICLNLVVEEVNMFLTVFLREMVSESCDLVILVSVFCI